jgi:adenylate cyclase
MPTPGSRLLRWCATIGIEQRDMPSLLAAFAPELVAAGVPARRINLTLRTLHPLFIAENWIWREGHPVQSARFRGTDRQDTAFQVSPMRPILEGTAQIVRHAIDARSASQFPLFAEYLAQGMTEYIAVAITTDRQLPISLSLMTDQEGGLSAEQRAILADGCVGLRPLFELFMQRQIAASICRTYIGKQTGPRVLAGDIRRGSVETLGAVIWFCDLRGFTPLTLALGTQGIVNLLNRFFEVVGEAVEVEGGEVLKFIGDAALAIFPLPTDGDPRVICDRALRAARGAQARLALMNAQDPHSPPLHASIALHVGEVSYGNIGAADRLDFTVIGAAVNQAARLSALSAVLSQSVLLSEAFAEACHAPVLSLGTHTLKGIAEPQRIFGLPNLEP